MSFKLIFGNEEFDSEILRKSDADQYVMKFAKDWILGKEEYTFLTSGSTGAPKEIRISRSMLELSARKSIEALGLSGISSALLCINPEFIGGTQMITRAIVGNYTLHVTEPRSFPIEKGRNPVDFISLVPLQLDSLISDPYGNEFLQKCKIILVGGAGLTPAIEKKAQNLDTPVYHSYGMTETASHIALRRVNGKQASPFYTMLPGNDVHLNEQNCLVFDGDLIPAETMTTHDIGEIKSGNQFLVKGRKDNIINSGGIKISPESLEKLIAENLDENSNPDSFLISSLEDEKLGHKITLVTDDQTKDWEGIINGIKWPQYFKPKELVLLPSIPKTLSGKIDRLAVREMIR